MLLHLLLPLLLVTCQATHFFGTVMTYHPGTTTDASLSVTLRYKTGFHSCSDSDEWECLSGNCGTETSLVVQTVFSQPNGTAWCQREGIMTRQLPTDEPFQLWLNSGDWINNIRNGISKWRASTLIEVRNRSDTGRANRSPQTTILPLLRVPSNCPRDFQLLAFDPDGDRVRCRYGNSSASECNPCTPPSVLNLSSVEPCTLHFGPTNSSQEGPYAVQLVVEDFPRNIISLRQTSGQLTVLTPHMAISKLPLQFVMEVVGAAPSCADGVYLPVFLHPTPNHGQQIFTQVGSAGINIHVRAVATTSTVSALLFSGPAATHLESSPAGHFTLRWTPSQSEQGQSLPLCFVARAFHRNEAYDSELRCVIVTVGSEPPPAVLLLKVKVSSPFPLSGSDTHALIQQYKDKLVRQGLPPGSSMRVVSSQDAATATPAGRG